MIRAPISDRQRIALGVAAVAAILVAYTVVAHVRHLDNAADRIVPTWTQLWAGIVRITTLDPDDHVRYIVADSSATGLRFLLGFGISVIASFVIGVAMGCFRRVRALLLPALSALARIPPTAVTAVIMAMVGTGMTFFQFAIAFGVFPILAESICLAVDDVPDELIQKSYTLGASQGEVIGNVIVPQILPKVLDAIRLQIGPALVYLISAELLAADMGFGYRIRRFGRLAQMDIVFPYLAALAVFGLVVTAAFAWIRVKRCPWYQPTKEGA
ncbi:MAG: ABC transporter permease subunit [bacterium]|nr:ABC transporter permease subunit [bacterium]